MIQYAVARLWATATPPIVLVTALSSDYHFGPDIILLNVKPALLASLDVACIIHAKT